MMDDNNLFIDTNILVHANIAESPFHSPAFDAIQQAQQAGQQLWISRQVIREYLVTLTRMQVLKTLSRHTIFDQINRFIQYFHIADETPKVTEQLLLLLNDCLIAGKQIHDANIVATMIAYQIPNLLTHNTQDFKSFSKLINIQSI